MYFESNMSFITSYSPLEQFLTLVLIPLYHEVKDYGLLDFSFTNVNITTICILGCFVFVLDFCIVNKKYFLFLPNI